MNEQEREVGVIAASTGNHGQSVAYAARLFGVKAIICAPTNANAAKVDVDEGVRSHRESGGRQLRRGSPGVRTAGCSRRLPLHPLRKRAAAHSGRGYAYARDLERAAANRRDHRSGWRGSGAAGACIAAKAINPEIAVIGVQAEAAPAAYLSWRERRPVDAVAKTWAEGLATGTAFELPQRILQRLLDDFVLVSEEAITEAVSVLLARTRLLVEGAGASPLAAALALRDRLRGRRVALILTGGNISISQLKEVLQNS